MAAYLYRMASGIPGAISRESTTTIEPGFFDSTKPFSAYGVMGKIVSGKFQPIEASDAVGVLYGLLVRPFPTQGANANDPIGTAVPPTSGNCDIGRRGYYTVKCNNGTPAKNGVVYVRVAAPTGPKPIGGFEATADSTNTVVVPNCTFNGAADAAGNVEIAYNI